MLDNRGMGQVRSRGRSRGGAAVDRRYLHLFLQPGDRCGSDCRADGRRQGQRIASDVDVSVTLWHVLGTYQEATPRIPEAADETWRCIGSSCRRQPFPLFFIPIRGTKMSRAIFRCHQGRSHDSTREARNVFRNSPPCFRSVTISLIDCVDLAYGPDVLMLE